MTDKRSSLIGVAIAATAIVVSGLGIIAALDFISSARGSTIEKASQPALTIPFVALGICAISAGWSWWLAQRRGPRHGSALLSSAITIMLFIGTLVLAWQAGTAHRELTVISMNCDANQPTMSQCEETAVDSIVLLQAITGERQWSPDAGSDNLERHFSHLPAGKWRARLTVDGPADTAAVSAYTERGGATVLLASLKPAMDPASGQLRWSAPIAVDTDIRTIRVAFFASDNPAVPSARIRFQTFACYDQNLREFDATQCDPIQVSSAIIVEQTPDSTRTWRQPHVTMGNAAIEVTNLEARDYVFQPDYVNIQILSQSTDVLIMPAAMDQLETNNIVPAGDDAFTISIGPSTGELVYNVYLFPSGPTYALYPADPVIRSSRAQSESSLRLFRFVEYHDLD